MRRTWALVGMAMVVAGPGRAAAAEAFDHHLFDRVLPRHVEKDLVDYASLCRERGLDDYLAVLGAAEPRTLPEAERLAFWINAYNAYTIWTVCDAGVPRSIRDVVARDRNSRKANAWQAPVVKVGRRSYTLDEVEHEVIRKGFQDPRVHFALICAARGCPPQRAEAYVGERLPGQLEHQAVRFLHGTSRGCRVDATQGVVYVSEIFSWYKADFGADDAAIGRYLARYLPDSLEKRVLESGRFRLVIEPFEWSLNGVPARR